MSGIRFLDCSKSTINWKNGNDVIICWHDVIAKFLWCCRVPLVILMVQVSCQYHYWFWSYFFISNLIRNPAIGNNLVWVLSSICRLGGVRSAKFGMNISKENLLNAAKFQFHRFHRFWVNKGKPTGEGVKNTPHPD